MNKRIAVITDKGVRALGLLDSGLTALEEAGYTAMVFDDVVADPLEHIVLSGAKNPSLLSGKIATDAGIILTPTHAQTHGRRYRYYVEYWRQTRANSNECILPVRLPASEIEHSVCNELATYLLDPIKLINNLGITNCPQEMHICVRKKAAEIGTMLNAPNKQAIDNTVCSPLMTSSATRDLKAGLWFLRFDILISSIVEDQSNQK